MPIIPAIEHGKRLCEVEVQKLQRRKGETTIVFIVQQDRENRNDTTDQDDFTKEDAFFPKRCP